MADREPGSEWTAVTDAVNDVDRIAACEAFVESTALSARQHFERLIKGDPTGERQIRMNEANYLSAVSIATSSKWPSCILDALVGLQIIYRKPKAA